MIERITKAAVFHVGTFDASQKCKDSHEGCCLSVSECPDEWRRIARGQVHGRIFVMKKEDGIFLDFHETLDNHRKELVLWGRKEGLVEDVHVFKVSYFDDEMNDLVVIPFLRLEEALEEASEGCSIERTCGTLMTAKLALAAGFRNDDSTGNVQLVHTMDALAIAKAQAEGLDGVWWEDVLDPLALSAPRGGILPDRIKEWEIFPLE